MNTDKIPIELITWMLFEGYRKVGHVRGYWQRPGHDWESPEEVYAAFLKENSEPKNHNQ